MKKDSPIVLVKELLAPYNRTMTFLLKKNQIEAYVSSLTSNGQKPVKARKTGYILARPAKAGETVVSYAGEGMKIIETINTANESDWILSKSNIKGEALTSSDNRKNEWIVKHETFVKKYEVLDVEMGLYRPISSTQLFIQINDEIDLESPWGSIEHLEAGAYLNITSPTDVYGIQKKDFEDTYEIVD